MKKNTEDYKNLRWHNISMYISITYILTVTLNDLIFFGNNLNYTTYFYYISVMKLKILIHKKITPQMLLSIYC